MLGDVDDEWPRAIKVSVRLRRLFDGKKTP